MTGVNGVKIVVVCRHVSKGDESICSKAAYRSISNPSFSIHFCVRITKGGGDALMRKICTMYLSNWMLSLTEKDRKDFPASLHTGRRTRSSVVLRSYLLRELLQICISEPTVCYLHREISG